MSPVKSSKVMSWRRRKIVENFWVNDRKLLKRQQRLAANKKGCQLAAFFVPRTGIEPVLQE